MFQVRGVGGPGESLGDGSRESGVPDWRDDAKDMRPRVRAPDTRALQRKGVDCLGQRTDFSGSPRFFTEA
jgi:hypothetical protein